MNSSIVNITTVLIPGVVSFLLFLVFTYLHEQSSQPYFRAWQLAWAAYSLHFVLDTFPASPIAFFVSELFLVAMALCIFVSTRLMRLALNLLPSTFRPERLLDSLRWSTDENDGAGSRVGE